MKRIVLRKMQEGRRDYGVKGHEKQSRSSFFELGEVKKGIVLFGLFLFISFSVLLWYVFYTAYFNGMRVVVFVDRGGEAHVEAILITFLAIPVCIYSFFRLVRGILVNQP